VLLVLGAPCQLRLLAGQEHGRTIPLSDIGSITKHDLPERVCKAHIWLRRALPSGSPRLRFEALHKNWLVRTSFWQAKARPASDFCWTEKREYETL
jgi:hypothetical protein